MDGSSAGDSPIRAFRRGSSGFESGLNLYLLDRLRLATLALSIMTGTVLVPAVVVNLAVLGRGTAGVLSTSMLGTATLGAIALAIHFTLRRARPTTRGLLALDATLALAVVALGAVLYVSVWTRGSTLLCPMLGFLLVGRAVIIPSTARRTLLISLSAPATILLVQLLLGPMYAYEGQFLPPELGTARIVGDQLYLVLCVGLAALASRVNFALRLRAFEASQVGQYELIEKIGEGAMGEVYRAHHAFLRRPTALKILKPERNRERDLVRFEREVRLTARLTHPNTIAIYDFGLTEDGSFFYAMEYLDGADLDGIIRTSGPLPATRVIHVLAQVLGALEEAHAVGLVHRDVKAGNIFLCRRGLEFDVAKVLDFGLVKDLGAESAQLTHADEICGTPHALSPEVIRGQPASPAADIYAVGALGCYLLTGRHLFDAANAMAYVSQQLTQDPLPPSARRAAVPADLEAALMRCLRKDPAKRPASARALRDELLACHDAGGWSQADAESWWAANGSRLAAGPSLPATLS